MQDRLNRCAGKNLGFLLLLLVLLLGRGSAQAATVYWDSNGSTAGAGATPNGTWGSNNYWSSNVNGTAATGAYTSGSDVVFSAGTDAVNPYTVTLSANQNARGLTFQEGTVTLKSNGTARTLTLGDGGLTIANTVAGPVTLGDGVAGNNLLISLSGSGTWTNNSSQNFAINNTAATFTRASGGTLTFNKVGTGNFVMSTTVLPNVNGIVGPWALWGTGTATRYVANSAGTLASFTGTAAANANALTTAATNYELTSTGTTVLTASRTANTIRSSGAGYTIDLSNTVVTQNLTLNGILAVGSSGTLTIQRTAGSGTVLAGSTGELVVAGPQSVAISAPISSGALTKDGVGTLTLSAANTYAGTTIVNGGDLLISHGSALGTTAGNTVVYSGNGTSPGGQLRLQGGITVAEPLTIYGVGDSGYNGALVNVSGTNTWSGLITVGSTSRIQVAGTLNITGGVTGSPGLTISGGTTNISTIAATLGTSNLYAHGGTLILGVAGNAWGTTQIAWGATLRTDVANALPSNQIVEMGGGTGSMPTSATGTLNLNGASQTIGGLQTQSAVLAAPGTSTRTITSASAATLTVNQSSTSTFDGLIQGSVALTKSGTGKLTLTNANGSSTYSGATNITAGILNIQGASVLGATTNGTSVASGATLQLQGGITVGDEALSLSGAGASGQNGALVNVSGTNNYGGLVTLGAAATISSDSGTLNLTNTGTITGSGFGLTLTGSGDGSLSSIIGIGTGTLTKTGAGAWTLDGSSTNTFTGATTVNAGTLILNKSSGVAVSGNVTIGDLSGTDTLQLGSTANTNLISDSAVVTVNSNGVFDLNGKLESISRLFGTGLVNNTSATAATLQVNAGVGFDGTFGGNITQTGGGAVTFNKQGANTVTLLSLNNNFSGTLRVYAGTLIVNSLGDSGVGSNGSGDIVIVNNANTARLQYLGSGATITRNISIGVNNTNLGNAVLDASGAGAWTINGNIAPSSILTGTFSKTLTLQGATNGAVGGVISNGSSGATLSLDKAGLGTWTLSGANTYSGGTTISGGTLVVNNLSGSATGTGGVTIGAAGNLAGAGFISGLVMTAAAASQISPGNSPGTLSLLGGLDASAGATFNFELGVFSDLIDLGSSTFVGSTAANGLLFNFDNAGGLTSGVAYTLITFGSSSGLDYSDLAIGQYVVGMTLDTSFGVGGWLINAGNLQIQFMLVPEPSSFLLLGIALIGAGWWGRKRIAATRSI